MNANMHIFMLLLLKTISCAHPNVSNARGEAESDDTFRYKLFQFLVRIGPKNFL